MFLIFMGKGVNRMRIDVELKQDTKPVLMEYAAKLAEKKNEEEKTEQKEEQ